MPDVVDSFVGVPGHVRVGVRERSGDERFHHSAVQTAESAREVGEAENGVAAHVEQVKHPPAASRPRCLLRAAARSCWPYQPADGCGLRLLAARCCYYRPVGSRAARRCGLRPSSRAQRGFLIVPREGPESPLSGCQGFLATLGMTRFPAVLPSPQSPVPIPQSLSEYTDRIHPRRTTNRDQQRDHRGHDQRATRHA
jgi:hypothetical protein